MSIEIQKERSQYVDSIAEGVKSYYPQEFIKQVRGYWLRSEEEIAELYTIY